MSGIVDIAIRYPGGRARAQSMQAASGVPESEILAVTQCAEFPVLGEHETAWQLACGAGADLLRRTGTDPAAIRQVIFAGSGEWDHPFWSPAAAVAHALEIRRAHCFEVANFCNAGATALQVAADRLAAEGGGLALVLVADRLSTMVDYTDPESVDVFNFGDAAAALLVEPGPGSFTLLHSAMHTDPAWFDYYRGEHRDGRVAIRRAPHRHGLSAAYVENFTALIRETLGAVGAKLTDLAYFLINHGDRDMHERLLRELGLPRERTVFNYDRLGHMGGADTFIALHDLARQDRLRRGDLILLASSAMGFSWGITALEYRR